ncbi:uncharacterized protein LOC110251231 [Exaiptasia diaphana]|uniref:Uncharacterized protein n=1 Tax=Exaiptasia diaphana TaxID=2652724 RepID=A0A913Y1E5_EXADI|nr:uncharacterized protein LOC110251231 [Exaiptasia diaphana]
MPQDQGQYKCFFRNYENGTVETTIKVSLMTCGDPGKPLNGYRTGNEFWAGNMVFYTCDPGYYLVGPSNRLCLENGAWSNSIPSCYKSQYSNILKNRTDYYKLMRVWLAPTTCMLTRWVPCYQSRLHGWASRTFHAKCDGKGPTITIIKVNKYIFGGYTDVSWHTKGSYSTSVNSFLFSFVNKDNLKPFKMKVFRSQHAIEGYSSWGPRFGGGADIAIYIKAGSNKISYTNLGNSYVLIKGYTYGSTKARNLLAGSYKFQPDEVEVFRQDGLEV